MAELNNFNFLYQILILFSIIANFVNSYRGVSIPAEHAYNTRYLVEENICHPLGRRDSIKIGENLPHPYNSSIILRPSYIFDRWINRTTDLRCKFVIKVKKGEHLMAVIQHMALRKNGDECLDYVMFRREDFHKTEKLCGVFDRPNVNSMQFTSNVYGDFDLDGEIETTIFVSKQSLRPDDVPLDLTIVYTPYKRIAECTRFRYDYTNNFDRFFDGVHGCLAEDYYCDGIYNCIPAICMDEKDCDSEIFSNGTGSKVTIGAVTTILLGFIIFVIGLWICKRHRKLCWSSDCAGPDINNDRVNNVRRSSLNSAHQSVPTAPMLEVAVLSSPIDKDLPPSYDSLFPEHNDASST